MTVTALSLCSNTPCTHKNFHKLLQYWLWKDFDIRKLWNVPTKKQAKNKHLLSLFHTAQTLNKKANNLTFSESQKSGISQVSWRFCIQVHVITYITRRTLTHRTELKAYWHFRHFANDQGIRKTEGKKNHINNLLLEFYILYEKKILKAVNSQYKLSEIKKGMKPIMYKWKIMT